MLELPVRIFMVVLLARARLRSARVTRQATRCGTQPFWLFIWPESEKRMRHVPIAEFKDRASEIIAAAEAGEEITITRHGREVVRLVAVEEDRMARHRAALEALLANREVLAARGFTATRDELVEWKNEGRR
jgi:prevent-host-death family protein